VRHAVALAIALVVAGCMPSRPLEPTPAATTTPNDVTAAAKAAIEQWRQAYELRSIDTLAKLYVHDPDTVVVVDGVPRIGWSAIQQILEDKLAHAKEIHVQLNDVRVVSLSPTVTSAVATMTREVSDGTTAVTEYGALTLVLVTDRTAGHWKIAVEHYSYKRPM
jgi:ketosteroid isomerase-like protein